MYLSEIAIKNFRCFDASGTTIKLKKGLNILVGENDSGKSALIDAIRIVLGTTDQSWYRFEQSDFHNENITSEIEITCKFDDLTQKERAAFLECLSFDHDKYALYIHYTYKYLMNYSTPRLSSNISSGVNGDGPTPSSMARELIKTTYLRPLRDAYLNMQSGHGSRLSQVLHSVKDLNVGQQEYSDGMDIKELSITGIADLTNKLLVEHPKLKDVNKSIGDTLSSRMLLSGDKVTTTIKVSGSDISVSRKLTTLLEKLDLTARTSSEAGKVGLGTSNILSMACELLLNRAPESSFLLIEEPEAHIHAQRQLRLIQSLEDEAAAGNHQIIITTHSPVLASVAKLENISIIKGAKAYSLDTSDTLLDGEDYYFLEKYLDATKANLFFAKSVIIVEGPSEELLLPTIAKVLGKDLTAHGVSIVNARGVGLKRFAGIFKRKDATKLLQIPVACITDRDVMPDCGPRICIDGKYVTIADYPKRRNWRTESEISDPAKYLQDKCDKADGQSVKTFVSDHWTLEYDLAYAGLFDEMLLAIVRSMYVPEDRDTKLVEKNNKLLKYTTLEERCSFLYSHFNSASKPEVAQQLSKIIEEKYKSNPSNLKNKLPQYILGALNHVVGGGE